MAREAEGMGGIKRGFCEKSSIFSLSERSMTRFVEFVGIVQERRNSFG